MAKKVENEKDQDSLMDSADELATRITENIRS